MDCGFDWNVFVDKYGIPGLVLAGVGFLVWFKVWPTFDRALTGIVAHMGEIAKSLAEILPELKTLTESAKDHENNTKTSLSEIHALIEKKRFGK